MYKKFNPISNYSTKLSLQAVAKAIKEIAPNSIIFNAVSKLDIDFSLEVVNHISTCQSNLMSVNDILVMSKDILSFEKNITLHMTHKNIEEVEQLTKGQNKNKYWYEYRKGVITASKSYDVWTKMNKLNKIDADMWELNQRISRMSFVNSNIPAIKYGREMEQNAVNCFYEILKINHKGVAMHDCGLFLDRYVPFIGGSPDRIVTCLCCPPACLEVKCPFSINYLSPLDRSIKLPCLIKNDVGVSLNKNHAYYMQCLVQMAVTRHHHSYFMVWTPHGNFIEHIKFDNNKWEEIKCNFIDYYYKHYLSTIFIQH